ncbi:putative hydrolase or acyltransferase (alpha/beta hydrolase superfamily) [Rubidibacter lacunae KORDI 51-2]|uniref:Putative hydrolase or acyltransferase (Alpha/beta hydrolase superfamily) n=1 Tax=Rubidibacter lacunae KORDI 51-2 TaxID=582515 RepID=U5DGX9_9CHRO|nr:alpha/beta hydrolase [Rubidibacter lacunae]ERN39814.1 putative hydrolase or acyltransferase (alpha/beta hydrolase superfamily) [Rubidibacter lacunae KORDI 51-2]
MPIWIQVLLLTATTIYQSIASWLEDRSPPPGKLISVGSHRLHIYTVGEASPTIVLDHSLGGVEGYFLIQELSKLARVCIYDRAGYGWSDRAPSPRSSDQIVKELNVLLSKAAVEPPYILVGNSFGSYNVRLYAHRFPEKVAGIVLTDALYETEMLEMTASLKVLRIIFTLGFLMSTLGSFLGIVRLLRILNIFELLKPELRHVSKDSLDSVKRSFCRPKHWITMTREMMNLDRSARQARAAAYFSETPIVSIKASSFFKPSIWTLVIPLKSANRLRENMHIKLCTLSAKFFQVEASSSSHFVWVDQPEIIVDAVKKVLSETDPLVAPIDSP